MPSSADAQGDQVVSIRPREAIAARAATAFVLLTLAALVLIPGLVNRRVYQLRAAIEAAEPARTLILQLQFSLVREMASLSELLLNGDVAYGERYRLARQAEERILLQLRPLAADLGPEIAAELAEVERRADAWHREVADTTILRARGEAGAPDDLREPDLFEAALAASATVDSAILVAASQNREAIRATEAIGMRLIMLLGVLALLAALAVGRLYGRLQETARVAEARRVASEEALEERARANEARTALIRGVTHDVKNPLGAAKGYAELLAMGIRGPVPDAQRDYLERMQRALDSALAIITDLLDMARMDSGGLPLHAAPSDATTLARDAMETHRAAAMAAGHTLQLSVSDGRIPLETDPARVQQILGNLLTNAIKYTPAPGNITVRASLTDGRRGAADGPWATIAVRDSGPGVPPALREAVFDEFSRISDASPIQGHGLGLAIARRMARMIGGDLTVGDAPDGGAVFTLWLPVVAVGGRERPMPAASAVSD